MDNLAIHFQSVRVCDARKKMRVLSTVGKKVEFLQFSKKFLSFLFDIFFVFFLGLRRGVFEFCF